MVTSSSKKGGTLKSTVKCHARKNPLKSPGPEAMKEAQHAKILGTCAFLQHVSFIIVRYESAALAYQQGKKVLSKYMIFNWTENNNTHTQTNVMNLQYLYGILFESLIRDVC